MSLKLKNRLRSWDAITLLIAFALAWFMTYPVLLQVPNEAVRWVLLIMIYLAMIIVCGDENYESSVVCQG